MDNRNIYDIMNQAHEMAKACNLAYRVDSTVAELNWAINSSRIEDKITVLRKVFAQCGYCIGQGSNTHSLPQWQEEKHYYEQTDPAVYNHDLIWLRDQVIPNMAMDQFCKLIVEKVAEDNLRHMGCSPQLLLVFKAMFGR